MIRTPTSGTAAPGMAGLLPDDHHFLREAAAYLERPTFLMKMARLVGKPAETLLEVLPARAQKLVAEATMSALQKALHWAVVTLPKTADGTDLQLATPSATRAMIDKHLHTAIAATTGAVGGFFGLAGIGLEIPATTTVMLRSIADIATRSGADLSDPLTRLQCLWVFSFGSPELDKMDSAYFSGRLGMALALKDAATFMAQRSAREIGEALTKGTAPVLVRLLHQIASRFQIVVTEKVAAQAVPLAGAATGALINAAFTDHFNTVARYHFGIVRLERLHGKQIVQDAYQAARLAVLSADASA